ncbi:MAG: imidazole glycerol phosphate synthase subunit HisH [Thermoanaerobaculales bacterium]|jgi:imidazole glycerol phosphate synthase glutamine amidotransferase subunit|nr:imidazole glycerol phosphate synthase subunit HisH [Thermoanaerobaculales bacterium]
MSEVVLLRTGTANLASVAAALRRAGAEVRLSDSADDAAGAERLVLPGVGAFGAVVEQIDALGLRSSLVERITAGRPTLAICLGLQVLAAGSEESPGADGLGVIPAKATALPPDVRSPQLGWNRVTASSRCNLLCDGVAYYANSYKLDAIPDGWDGALTDHGGRFVAAVERGPVLACQFHPELSGAWGQGLVERWLEAV